ncbi:MAG: hypothetical protein ACLQDM_19955 [Bradyrhizobium sp.]
MLAIQVVVGNTSWALLPKMDDMRGVIQAWLRRAAFGCALSIFASNPSDAMDRSHHSDIEAGGAKLAFLSGPDGEVQPPATEAPPLAPQPENKNFDGAWTFTGAGCPNSGSVPARIVEGKIIVRGGSGQVDPDGTLHSVGAGNGMTLTAVGQLSGNTGSGTFNRSDGCIGRWIAIKRETLRRRRP